MRGPIATLTAGLTIALVPAPARPQPADTDYIHAGAAARLTLSAGVLSGTFDDDVTTDDQEFEGTVLGMDAQIGATPIPGFILGVHLGALVAPSVEFERRGPDGGPTGDGTVSTYRFALFLDAFPWPRAGFHWGLSLGYGVTTFHEVEVVTNNLSRRKVTTSGFAGDLWTGYDFCLASDWSLGPVVRASATFVSSGAYSSGTGLLTLGVSGSYQ